MKANNYEQYKKNKIIRKKENNERYMNNKYKENQKGFNEKNDKIIPKERINTNIENKRIKRVLSIGCTFRRANINYLLLIFVIANISKPFYGKINFYKNSIVTLKVSGNGVQKVFYDKICDIPFTKPNKIYIDNNAEASVQSSYELTSENIIKLEWTETITISRCMFKDCDTIVEMNFSDFDTSLCIDMLGMFRNCTSLIKLDLSQFDTKSVTQMSDMFWNCKSLISLDISSFDTSKVSWGMGHMFCDCKSLVSLNLSNFNMNSITHTDNMFNGCESLKILDFPNLQITSDMKCWEDMFLNCKNLLYINLKNFKSSKTLDQNFLKGTPKNLVIQTNNEMIINIIKNIDCNKYIRDDNWYQYIKKINTENNICSDDCFLTNYKYEYDFKCYPSCFNSTYNNSYKCENCHPDCLECEGPYTSNSSNCKICHSSDLYLYLGNCIENCPRENYVNDTTQQKTCKCELLQCLTCSNESLDKNLCISCDKEKGFYPVYDDYYTKNYPYINCSSSPQGYYLDRVGENYMYKLCYSSCKTCNISGDEFIHNCNECKEGYNFELIIGENKNCYKSCSYYHYFDKNNDKSYCTKNFTCPDDFNKLIEDKKECVFDCSKDEYYKYEFRKKCYKDSCPSNSTQRDNSEELDKFSIDKQFFCKPICNEEFRFEMITTQECVKNCDYKYIFDKSCILNYKSQEKEKEGEEGENKSEKDEIVKALDIILENVESGFTSDDYDTSNLEQGNNEVVELDEMTVTFTTTENQKNDKNNANMTTIDLGECEKKLREAYNIPPNEILFMKKIDVKQEGMKIPKVEYDVYSKLNGISLVKLNLSYCENTKVDISVPTLLTDSLDKLNSSSEYYNDLCYTATSDSGTDIILNDRKTEFVENNKTVCQDNCVFSEYDYESQKAKCSCDVVESSSSFADINIDKTRLYNNFVNIKNIANINLLVCYKKLFSKKGILNNYGSYSLMPILLAHFIIILLFYIKNLYNEIKDTIKDISLGITNWELVEKEERKIERLKKRARRNKKLKIIREKKLKQKKSIKPNNIESIKIIPPIYYQYCDKINPPKKQKSIININNNKKDININNNILNNKIEETQKEKKTIHKKNKKRDKKELLKKTKEIMAYNDEELNNLSYELALKYDKRNFCQYYFSLLKTKHPIMFTFFNNSDYNSKIIKIDLFLFSFTLYYAVNALFFSDNTMHKIYEDKGSFNFIYQLPQILYSSLISAIFSMLLKMLALSEGLILNFKKKKEKTNLDGRMTILDKKLRLKFLSYFILSSIFLLFFWYYLSMFCAIYINTQIHLIKDTFISFGLSLLYPLGFYLIPGVFRIPALSNRRIKRNYLYKASKIFQMI